jgi:hypothetical protein
MLLAVPVAAKLPKAVPGWSFFSGRGLAISDILRRGIGRRAEQFLRELLARRQMHRSDLPPWELGPAAGRCLPYCVPQRVERSFSLCHKLSDAADVLLRALLHQASRRLARRLCPASYFHSPGPSGAAVTEGVVTVQSTSNPLVLYPRKKRREIGQGGAGAVGEAQEG